MRHEKKFLLCLIYVVLGLDLAFKKAFKLSGVGLGVRFSLLGFFGAAALTADELCR